MTSTKNKTYVLVECAILLAMATLLSFFPKFEGLWPNGGSITLCSMLPIIIISYRNGIKWGLLSGLAFSFLQLLTGGFYSVGTSMFMVFATLLLDYILPYTAIGLGGMFKGKFKSTAMELSLGVIVSLLIRYACHVISGFVLWYDVTYATKVLNSEGFAFGVGAKIAENFSGTTLFALYDILYNGSYMIPEIILTTIGAIILSKAVNYNFNNK